MRSPDQSSPESGRRSFLRTAGLAAGAGGAASLLQANPAAAAVANDVFFVYDGTATPTPPTAATGFVYVVHPAASQSANVANINGAVDAAARANGWGADLPGGGMVLMTNGAFPVNAPIVMRPGVVLSGSGWGTQILRRFNGGPLITFQATSGTTPGAFAAEVRDLYLVGSRGQYPDPANHGIFLDATNPSGSPGWQDTFCRLANLRVAYNAGTGVIVADHPGSAGSTSRACFLHWVMVTASDGDGFLLEGSDAFLSHCIAGSNDGAGFRVNAGNLTLTGCSATYNNTSGFVVTGARPVLSGCHAQDNEPDGFLVSGTTGADVSGCQGDTNEVTNFHISGGTTLSSLTGLGSVYRVGGRYPAKPTAGGILIDGGATKNYLTGCSPDQAGGLVGSFPAGDGSITQVATPT